MKVRISVGVRDALGRLSQVISCADRALQRDITSEPEDVEPDTGPEAAHAPLSILREEGVEPRRYSLANGAGKGLFLRVV
jgi:hypothetical protein